MEKIRQAAEWIRRKTGLKPEIGIILGTGLGEFAGELQIDCSIAYSDVPHFPVATNPDHSGRLLIGKLSGKNVLVMQGRVHYYEGYSMQEVAFPVHVMRELGVKTLIVTNAVGGINEAYSVGDLVLLKDHIKFFNDTPLRGRNLEEYGPRFNDMCSAYPKRLRDVAHDVMEGLPEGVYAYMPGPCYETPAEIRMLRMLGADVVGMSTVPEVITAAHHGMEVLGISFVTNMAADLVEELTHITTPERAKKNFCELVRGVVSRL